MITYKCCAHSLSSRPLAASNSSNTASAMGRFLSPTYLLSSLNINQSINQFINHNFHIQNTHKHNCFTALDFVWDNPGELVPEETFTHLHLSWSSVIPYLLPPSIMIHGILPVQLTCLRVFLHNLSPSFLWSTSWPDTLNFILHTFLHSITVFFLQHMPILSQRVLL